MQNLEEKKLVYKVATIEDLPNFALNFLSIQFEKYFALLNIILLLVFRYYYLTHVAFAIVGTFFVKFLLKPQLILKNVLWNGQLLAQSKASAK